MTPELLHAARNRAYRCCRAIRLFLTLAAGRQDAKPVPPEKVEAWLRIDGPARLARFCAELRQDAWPRPWESELKPARDFVERANAGHLSPIRCGPVECLTAHEAAMSGPLHLLGGITNTTGVDVLVEPDEGLVAVPIVPRLVEGLASWPDPGPWEAGVRIEQVRAEELLAATLRYSVPRSPAEWRRVFAPLNGHVPYGESAWKDLRKGALAPYLDEVSSRSYRVRLDCPMLAAVTYDDTKTY